MKDRTLFTSLNDLDKEIIEEAENTPQKRTPARTLRVILIAAAAVLLVAALVFGGVMLLKKPDVPEPATDPLPTAATVYIDVNPSVAFSVSQNGTVLAVKGVNDDGKNLPLDEKLVGSKAEDAVKRLIALVIDKGYLTLTQNALLLSVRSEDPTLANVLLATLEQSAMRTLDILLPDGRVIAQIVDFEERYRELNEYGNVSPGRAKYIFDVLDRSDEYSKEDLIKMNFTKLLSIAESLGQPVGNRIKITESVAVAIARFKEVCYPDAEMREDYIPTNLPNAPAGIEPKVHVLYVTPANGEELCFEIMVCRGSAAVAENDGRAEHWTLDTVNLKKDDVVYQYAIDPENGRIFYEKILHAPLSEEDALDLAVSFCGKTKDGLIAKEVADMEDQFLVNLLFKDGDEYDARNVLVYKEIFSAVSCWKVTPNLWEAYLRQILNDDLHKTYPDKDVKDALSVAGFCDERVWGGALYLRCLSKFDGGWHHSIIDCQTGEVVYSEITGSDTCSAAFEEKVEYYRALAQEAEAQMLEDNEPTPTTPPAD